MRKPARVKRGERIIRMRVAMAAAMPDCETALRENTLTGTALTMITAAHMTLKIELERP